MRKKRSFARKALVLLFLTIAVFGVHYFKNNPMPQNDVGSLKTHSTHAIMLNLQSKKVLFSKSSNQKTYPASLTKIMTCILAIEKLPNLNKHILLPADIFIDLNKQHASMAGFAPNEKAKAIDLLYGTMLPSGAEAATALANEVSGSQEDFVDLMNLKAKDLGMNHTHFANPTGMYDANHYTTVKDLSVLLQYALKNQTFREIFTTERYSTAPTNINPSGITFTSTLFQNMESPEFDGGEIIGGKTGYTDEAGLCLASLAKKGDSEYILITTGAVGDHQTEQYNITDAKKIYSDY